MKTIKEYFSLSNEKISSIDNYITEKLKLSDVKEIVSNISKDQLKQLLLYCKCFLKEPDLREDCGEGYIWWGEMERYEEYNIKWYDKDHKWISDHGCNTEDDPLLDKMENIGGYLSEITEIAHKQTGSEKRTMLIIAHIIHYLIEFFTTDNYDINNFDFNKIKKVNDIRANKTVVYYYDDNNEIWNQFLDHHTNMWKQIYEKTLLLAKSCKEILE